MAENPAFRFIYWNMNYHLEHHLLMTVPHYRLRGMRKMLASRGALEGTASEGGYVAVLRRAAGAPA